MFSIFPQKKNSAQTVHLLQTLNFLHAVQIKLIWNKNTFLSQIAFRESCIDATVAV